MKNAIFRLKAKNIAKHVLKQLKKEKLDEKMKVFESVQITNARCGVCAVDFREMPMYSVNPAEQVTSLDRQTSDDSETSGILQPSSPILLPQPGFATEKQIQSTPSPDSLKENPLTQMLRNLSDVVSETAAKEWKQETRKEHEQSQKHKEKVKYFQHFRDKYNREISDVLDEVRDFTQRYKLGTKVAEIHFKDEFYGISNFLREKSNVETKLFDIIRTCDWENDKIKNDVDSMFGLYHSIESDVKDKAREIKEVSTPKFTLIYISSLKCIIS